MKHVLIGLIVSCVLTGCCIMSRNISKETRVLRSDYYLAYTNGVQEIYGWYKYDDGTKKPAYRDKTIYYSTSYVGGPYTGSTLYPATRNVLNILSGWSYSSAASGNYMNNLFTLPTYPIYIIELPIQFVLDTVLIPFDLWNEPDPPEGYVLIR